RDTTSQLSGICPPALSQVTLRSELIPQPSQFLPNQSIEFFPFSHLLAQFLRQLPHLLRKSFVILFNFFGTHITSRRQHMPMLSDLSQWHTAAESCNVLVFRNRSAFFNLTAPCSNSFSNTGNRVIIQLSLHARNHL